MSSLASKIKKADLFGKFLIFEEEESQKHTTTFGLVITIIIVITCMIVGFLFGKEIYERKNPIVYNSNDKLSKSIIKLKEFPVFFTYVSGAGVYQPNASKYINMELTHLIMPKTYAEYPTLIYYSGHKKCEVSEFSEKYQPYVQSIYDSNSFDINCILYNEDMYFSDNYSNLDSSLINVRFKLNSSNTTQEFLDEQKAILKNIYISMVYVDSFIDSSSYHDPINYYNFVHTQQLSAGLLQRKFLNIERLKLITHKGWLLEDIEEKEVFSTRSSTKDVINDDNGNLYWISFSSPNIRTKIVRTYMKVQELFAKIGGFFNALFIIATVISKNYVDFSFYKYIYIHFYKFKKPEIALTKTQRSTVHRHTIDKLVKKFAVNEFNMIKEDMNKNTITYNTQNTHFNQDNKNNLYKNIQDKDNLKTNLNINKEDVILTNNNIKDNRLKFSNNESNENSDNNNEKKNNKDNRNIENIIEIDNYDKLIINDNSQINQINNNKQIRNNIIRSTNTTNNTRKNNLSDSKLVNNFIDSINKNNSNNLILNNNCSTDNRILNTDNRIISTIANANSNINNNINFINSYKSKESISLTLNEDLDKFSDENIHYFSYLYNDFMCCRNKFKFQKQVIQKVLSFENLLEVNYDYYIKTDIANANIKINKNYI